MANSDAKILLIGGGGHCCSVIDTILSGNLFRSVGIVDSYHTGDVMGIPIVGNDEDLERLHKEGWTHAFITLGSVGNPSIRRKMHQIIYDIGFIIPNIIDTTAVVAGSAVLKDGIFVGKRAVINANAHVGTGAILNSGCIVEHDCKVGDFAHISPGAVLCGNVLVENNVHIGAGSVVRQQLCIGQNTLVGAGSVVLREIPEGKVAYGNPCRVVKNI